MTTPITIERHPWQPFIPQKPSILMLGAFPPKPEKWSMDFFFPNRINDMWRLMGIIFYNDANHLWDNSKKCFRLEKIKQLLDEKGIAMWDTAMAVRRLRDNASDKYLEIVETIDLRTLLDNYPTITTISTAGEKATSVVAELAGCEPPRMGSCTKCKFGSHSFVLWRMPSSSRAYPLSLDKKAEYYNAMFVAAGIIQKPLSK